MSDSGRETGILTENHRQYLQDYKEGASSRANEQTGIRIRRRIRNGLIDASLLLRTLNQRDIEQIFSPEPHTNENREDVIDGAIDFLALCEIGFGKARISFELALEEAIKRAETYRGTPLNNVDVTIDRDRRTPSGMNFDRVTMSFGDEYQPDHSEKELLDDLADSGVLDPEEVLRNETTPPDIRKWAKDRLDS